MRIVVRTAAWTGLAVAATLAIAACGSSTATPAGSGSSGTGAGATDPIAVVTTTNVWGDIANQIGGDQVAVTSLIIDPAADPHSFEPTAQAQLALSKAALIVQNGGGYDEYVQAMLEAAGTSAPVINAVEVSGLQDADDGAEESHSTEEAQTEEAQTEEAQTEEAQTEEAQTEEAQAGEASGVESQAVESQAGESPAVEEHEHGEFNEHVWYDLPTADRVAARIADELIAIRPEQAEFFRANLAAFSVKIAGLTTKIADIKVAHGGADVAITEPVPLYLTEAAGLLNLTPVEFSEAIEQGTDVPPTVLADTLALFTGRKVVALVYNEQTSSPETEEVLAAAQDNSIAVVGVSETLPEGKDYLSWMDANITALAGALSG